jgi:phospholipid N-methyltransferase
MACYVSGDLMGRQEKGVGNLSRLDSRQHHGTANGNGNGNGKSNGNGAATRRGSGLFLFARTFLKYPNMVGWMLPSSSWVVDRVLNEVNWGQAAVVVEYGPGLGAFTGKLLERMRPDATLIAFEINPIFIESLKKQFADPRLRLIERSATEVALVLGELGLSAADYVISGIPFKTMPHPLRDEVVRQTHRVLRAQGRFLVYQLSTVVRPYLESVFADVRTESELLSLPPARMFYCAR